MRGEAKRPFSNLAESHVLLTGGSLNTIACAVSKFSECEQKKEKTHYGIRFTSQSQNTPSNTLAMLCLNDVITAPI